MDAFFRRWHMGEYGDTLKIGDEVERFCVINLAADIERVAMDDLLGKAYEQRLQAARDKLRHEHDLGG